MIFRKLISSVISETEILRKFIFVCSHTFGIEGSLLCTSYIHILMKKVFTTTN